MKVTTEDLASNLQLDAKTCKYNLIWGKSVFQDVQESIDATKLYFLYEPQAEEIGVRPKNHRGLVIFDLETKCFSGVVPIDTPAKHVGKLKYLFALKDKSPQEGSAFVLVTEEAVVKQTGLNVYRIDLAEDGLSIIHTRALIQQKIVYNSRYYCSMSRDELELAVVTSPQLQVLRVDCKAETSQQFSGPSVVYKASMNDIYDGFIENETIIFLSATPDGYLDNSRVHTLNFKHPNYLNTHICTKDQQNEMPSPRKHCGVDYADKAILMAGGEAKRRFNKYLDDYWVLNTQTFQWIRSTSTMPYPVIKPRLITCYSGNVYIWGRKLIRGMENKPTNICIFRVSGMQQAVCPPAYSVYNPAPPPYQSGSQPSSSNSLSNRESQQASFYGSAPPAYHSSNDETEDNSLYPTSSSNQPSTSNSFSYSGQSGQEAPPYPTYSPNRSNLANEEQEASNNQNGDSESEQVASSQEEVQTTDGQSTSAAQKKKKRKCIIA